MWFAGSSSPAPVVSDGRILVLEPASVVALDAAGRPIPLAEGDREPAEATVLPAGDRVGGASFGGRLVFAVDVTGRVYGLDAETGAEVWDQALNDASPLTPPVLTEEHLLVPTSSGSSTRWIRRRDICVFRVDSGGSFLRGLAGGGDGDGPVPCSSYFVQLHMLLLLLSFE